MLFDLPDAASLKFQAKKHMTVLQEIQKWAVNLPAWQQDAIVRLFANGELTSKDYDELYALLKTEHGIVCAEAPVGKKLAVEQVAAMQRPETLVQVTAIKNLVNVNALAENQSLPVSPEGLTIIYGDNGSGKSGYSRVLKKACRARDQSEDILPDAKLPPGKAGKASAWFELKIDGVSSEVQWVDGAAPPDPLSSIAIFDSRCARAYIDDQNDFSFVPYGLDILEGLAKACHTLKTRIESDISAEINTAAFAHLANTQTEVGKLIANLSSKTSPAYVETLAALSEDEIARSIELGQVLKEGNPKEKSQRLNLCAGRITKLFARCTEKLEKVGDAEAAKLHSLIDDCGVAEKAAEISSKQFRETPGQLAGTGGAAWQALFDAARKFAAESHPDKEFPHLGADAPCPLCQQPLGSAADRLIAFDGFIQNDLEKSAREKRAAANTAYKLWETADLEIGLDEELQAELDSLDPGLSKSCAELQASIIRRRDAVKSACSGKIKWDDIGAEPSVSGLNLKTWADKLASDAAALEKVSDDKTRAALETENEELTARKRLQPIKSAIIETIERMVLQAKLKDCLASVRTNSISIKSTELTEKIVSAELASALNNEFRELDVGELHVRLETKTERGKTLHKLVLNLPGRQRPSLVLSEGEQRALAIASFLAEVNVGGGKGGIIFDDPVSSLDHRRREHVAARLVMEAKKRQVIILTHDIYFLCILQQEAKRADVTSLALSLYKNTSGSGVADKELPFEGTVTSKRIGQLRQMHVACDKLHRGGDEKEYRRQAGTLYFYLRLAWERAVEEVLLRNVVLRFRESVETQRLKEVVVEDTDYDMVNSGMVKCSKFAHDRAAIGMISIPPPDELARDIEQLESWRVMIEKRSQEIKKRRSS